MFIEHFPFILGFGNVPSEIDEDASGRVFTDRSKPTLDGVKFLGIIRWANYEAPLVYLGFEILYLGTKLRSIVFHTPFGFLVLAKFPGCLIPLDFELTDWDHYWKD